MAVSKSRQRMECGRLLPLFRPTELFEAEAMTPKPETLNREQRSA